MKKKWYRPVLYICARSIQPLLLFLPRVIVLGIAKLLGWSAFYFLKRERERTLSHIRYAFGSSKDEQWCTQIVRRVFVNMALTAADFARFPRMRMKHIEALVTTVGMEKVEDIMQRQERGLIVITAHLGNWELIAATFMNHGYTGCVLGTEIYYSLYNQIIIDLRESQKVYTFYRDRSPKDILRRLKSGEVVGILPDQDIADVEGIFLDFFGKPAYTPTGPVKLALAADVPIILAFMVRAGDRYRLLFDDIIEPVLFEGEDKTKAVERMTRRWHTIVERYIKAYPDQWVWMHNRWKTKK